MWIVDKDPMNKLLLIAAGLLVGAWFLKGGAGSGGLALPEETVPVTELVETICESGEAVDLGDHVAADRWTLFEYGADW